MGVYVANYCDADNADYYQNYDNDADDVDYYDNYDNVADVISDDAEFMIVIKIVIMMALICSGTSTRRVDNDENNADES